MVDFFFLNLWLCQAVLLNMLPAGLTSCFSRKLGRESKEASFKSGTLVLFQAGLSLDWDLLWDPVARSFGFPPPWWLRHKRAGVAAVLKRPDVSAEFCWPEPAQTQVQGRLQPPRHTLVVCLAVLFAAQPPVVSLTSLDQGRSRLPGLTGPRQGAWQTPGYCS